MVAFLDRDSVKMTDMLFNNIFANRWRLRCKTDIRTMFANRWRSRRKEY